MERPGCSLYRRLVTILVYGAANPDLVHLVDRLPVPGDDLRSWRWSITWGGKAANAAVALATWGVDVRLTGLVSGFDPLGDALFSELDRPFLDLSTLERSVDEHTRHCVVLVEPGGDRTIVCTGYEGARWSAVTEWDGVEVVLLDGFGGDAAVSVACSARSRSIRVVWLDCPTPHTELADWVVWSSHEHTPEEARESSATVTILTCGGSEVLAVGPGTEWRVRPPQVEVVDATGAGDVLTAGCVRGITQNWDAVRVVRWAVAAGAALAAKGREAGMPTIAEVDAQL